MFDILAFTSSQSQFARFTGKQSFPRFAGKQTAPELYCDKEAAAVARNQATARIYPD
jgi:hypothetical protein